MNRSVKTDDVIFNFFKQICDEKDDIKCVDLGNSWITAMETNLDNIEVNLEEADKIMHIFLDILTDLSSFLTIEPVWKIPIKGLFSSKLASSIDALAIPMSVAFTDGILDLPWICHK